MWGGESGECMGGCMVQESGRGGWGVECIGGSMVQESGGVSGV